MARLKKEVITVESKEPKFTKSQLLKAQRYESSRDALSAILNDGKTYTHEAVKTALDQFYKGGKQ